MNSRGISNVTTVIIAALAALLVAPLLMSWVVIDVDTAPPDNVHLKIPFPLALARVALLLVPDEDLHAELPPEVAAHGQQMAAAIEALERCPDATLLTVRARDANVHIAKVNGVLRIDVEADDATVHCAVPVEAVKRMLARWDGRHADPRMVLDFLSACGRGPLVSVDSREAKVRVAMW